MATGYSRDRTLARITNTIKLSTIHQDGAFYYVGGGVILLFGMLVIADLVMLWVIWFIAYLTDYEPSILVLTIVTTLVLGVALFVIFCWRLLGIFSAKYLCKGSK